MQSIMLLVNQFSLEKSKFIVIDARHYDLRPLYRFFSYCDKFDRQNHCQGSREFFFIQLNNNIISFILNKFHVRSTYYAPDDQPHLR